MTRARNEAKRLFCLSHHHKKRTNGVGKCNNKCNHTTQNRKIRSREIQSLYFSFRTFRFSVYVFCQRSLAHITHTHIWHSPTHPKRSKHTKKTGCTSSRPHTHDGGFVQVFGFFCAPRAISGKCQNSLKPSIWVRRFRLLIFLFNHCKWFISELLAEHNCCIWRSNVI